MGKAILELFHKYVEDFFIIVGLVLVNVATFRIGITAGLYCLGASFLLIGIVVSQIARKG